VDGGEATHGGLGLGTQLKGEEVLTHNVGFSNVVGGLSVGVSMGHVHSLRDQEFDRVDFPAFGGCVQGAVAVAVFSDLEVGAHLQEGVDHGLVSGLTGGVDGQGVPSS
jgi:hypothetical protein